MVAITIPGASLESRERLFFFLMAVVVSGSIAAGFALRVASGAVTFDHAWWVHLHAASFMAWLGVYVAQSWLALRGSMAGHRTLGRAAVALAAGMTVLGIAITAASVAGGRTPPFFTPAYFLALDWLNVAVFAGLVGAGVTLRRRSDWHRRLMLCATLCVGIPGFARLILLAAPPPDIVKLLAAVALFLAPALAFDLVSRRRIHPAYVAASGALLAMGLLVEPLSRLPPLAAVAERLSG